MGPSLANLEDIRVSYSYQEQQFKAFPAHRQPMSQIFWDGAWFVMHPRCPSVAVGMGGGYRWKISPHLAPPHTHSPRTILSLPPEMILHQISLPYPLDFCVLSPHISEVQAGRLFLFWCWKDEDASEVSCFSAPAKGSAVTCGENTAWNVASGNSHALAPVSQVLCGILVLISPFLIPPKQCFS